MKNEAAGISLKEVLAKLKKEGVNISKRTFEYYQRLELIPKPSTKRVGKKGRGVYGVYDPNLVAGIRRIFELKAKCLTLGEIRAERKLEVADRYKAVLQTWGFSGFSLPEMKGYAYNPEKDQSKMRSGLAQVGASQNQIDSVMAFFVITDLFGGNLLKDLRWWHPDIVIEAHALGHIAQEAESVLLGLLVALSQITREHDVAKTQAIRNVTKRLIGNFLKRTKKLQVLISKVKGRLAEILGKYENQTKEYWMNRARKLEGLRV